MSKILVKILEQSEKQTDNSVSVSVETGFLSEERQERWREKVGWVDYNKGTVPHPLCR